MIGFFLLPFIRGADEHSGRLQYGGHKGEQHMDLCGLGAAVSPITCLIAWGLSDRKNPLTILQVTPKYMLLGGVIGAFITFTVIKSMDALGPAKAVMLIVIAQLLAAYLIELAGSFGVEKADFSSAEGHWHGGSYRGRRSVSVGVGM